jgi:hypothetical protein
MTTIHSAIVLFLGLLTAFVEGSGGDYHDQAIKLMEESPLLDTHIDLPQIIRSLSAIPPHCLFRDQYD